MSERVRERQGAMKNVTVLTTVGEEDEVALAEAWFRDWAGEIAYNSGDRGCGCCVDMWDVTCSDAAAEALPYAITCCSQWSQPEIFEKAKPSRWKNLFDAVFWRWNPRKMRRAVDTARRKDADR